MRHYSGKAYVEWVADHYRSVWGVEGLVRQFNSGRVLHVQPVFQCLEFAPHGDRNMWTYATCGMGDPTKSTLVEVHMFSKEPDDIHLETLAAIAHYHLTGDPIGLHHTVNLGRPWVGQSGCTYCYLSLPYLDGPGLENGNFQGIAVQFLWLIPITDEELAYKKSHGAEALEQQFEKRQFDFVDPMRSGVV